MSVCEFGYSCCQVVTIKAIEQKGLIDARKDTSGIHEYLVVYWVDGQRRCEWMSSWELEP